MEKVRKVLRNPLQQSGVPRILFCSRATDDFRGFKQDGARRTVKPVHAWVGTKLKENFVGNSSGFLFQVLQ